MISVIFFFTAACVYLHLSKYLMEVINDYLRLADSSHFCGHPDISANALVLGFVIYGVRGPAGRPGSHPSPPWSSCAASLLCTTVSPGSLVVRIKHVLKSKTSTTEAGI